MEEFTFDPHSTNTPLEVIEWDNIRWENTQNADVMHVLYIGDSISCGTREVANQIAKGTMYFDGFGSSKALDNPYLKPSLELFIAQSERIDFILFNNGLHGWHLSEQEYREHFENIVKFLMNKCPDVPLFIVLTTFIDCKDLSNDRVIVRNEKAVEVAEKYGLQVIDFYSLSENNSDLLLPDKIHFTNEGYGILANELIETINEASV